MTADNPKKKARPTFTLPTGTFKWPKLIEPDFGTKEYPKENGELSTKVVYQASDPLIQKFLKAIDPLYQEALAEGAEAFSKLKVEQRKKLGSMKENPLYSELYDQETEQPTGEIEFKVARAYSGQFRDGPKKGKTWKSVVPIFDSSGNRIPTHDKNCEPLQGAIAIYGGTKGRISVSAAPYFVSATGVAGLKLYLEGVQIIELSSRGEKSADSLGFGRVDGGYAHSEAARAGFDDDDADSADAASNDDEGNPDF